jgi:hypothetical protein
MPAVDGLPPRVSDRELARRGGNEPTLRGVLTEIDPPHRGTRDLRAARGWIGLRPLTGSRYCPVERWAAVWGLALTDQDGVRKLSSPSESIVAGGFR